MSMKISYINRFSALLAVAMIAFGASAQERDPFSPTGSNTGVISKMRDLVSSEPTEHINNFNSASPLISARLSSYRVAGVILSEEKKIASVKAVNGLSYLVKIGDSLGSEGGKVANITIDGITVQTESQEFKISVDNIIEVPVNAANN